MHASVPSAIVVGASGRPVVVEAQSGNGLPAVHLVGLADSSVRESLSRVRSALESSPYDWPNRRITISLAPSNLKKRGTGLDLPIALAILKVSGQIEAVDLGSIGASGELGLDGAIRGTEGMMAIASSIEAEEVYVPADSALEAAAARPGCVVAVRTLTELVEILLGERAKPSPVVAPIDDLLEEVWPDMAEVRGQFMARYALEVAAAGGHHLLMVGPPGAGKSMLAARLPGLLPPLSYEDSLAVTQIHSAAGFAIPPGGLIRSPPFRAPHHGLSPTAMVGGGSTSLRPGEISCAHGGVLFLDELGEFPVSVLEALRQPLEEGQIRVARISHSATMPARFQLIGAMNPCPCGQGGPDGGCRCSDAARARYARKLSGPLLDRFDLRVELAPPDSETLLGIEPAESSEKIRLRVVAARDRSLARGFTANSSIPAGALEELAPLDDASMGLLQDWIAKGHLTGRGLKRVRAVALTISDLGGDSPPLPKRTVAQALMLRPNPDSVLGGRY